MKQRQLQYTYVGKAAATYVDTDVSMQTSWFRYWPSKQWVVGAVYQLFHVQQRIFTDIPNIGMISYVAMQI
jgi:hypothetical protein